MTSLPGIGVITATEVILATKELSTIAEPKKMACQAGVAPFERSAAAVQVRQ